MYKHTFWWNDALQLLL